MWLAYLIGRLHRQVGLLRGLLYVGAQCVGAIGGAALLRWLLPSGEGNIINDVTDKQTKRGENMVSIQG